jgi:microcin C transport system permease protein
MSITRWERFKSHKRAKWSLYILFFLTMISLGAEFIANDCPLIVKKEGHYFFPVLFQYAETDFGGEFKTPANYRSSYFKKLIYDNDGWMVWPLIRFSYDTHDFKLNQPAPSPPSLTHPLGTDDRARDILANLIYGYRISLGFGLGLTFVCALMGLYIGALQGFYGGKIDLYGQRFIEIWTGLPSLYVFIWLAKFGGYCASHIFKRSLLRICRECKNDGCIRSRHNV